MIWFYLGIAICLLFGLIRYIMDLRIDCYQMRILNQRLSDELDQKGRLALECFHLLEGSSEVNVALCDIAQNNNIFLSQGQVRMTKEIQDRIQQIRRKV